MKNIFYAILIIVIVLAAFLLLFNWTAIMAWWNKPKGNDNAPGSPSCQQEYDDAKAEWAKSGKSCIQTVADIVCPSDSTFVVSVNPCVEQLLKDKGWKSIEQNSNNSNGNNNSVQYDLEVSNPNGAFMYYKQPTQTIGVYMYAKSNMLIPFGTKLTQIGAAINTYQGLPKQVVETTYKQYGSNSGFFATEDIKKI